MVFEGRFEDSDTIVEPEEYRSEEQKFDHQVLVMERLRECGKKGSVELMEGWMEERPDKQGNVHKTYHPSTYAEFIGAVKSAMATMHCDYDEDAKKKIANLLEDIQERKRYWLNEEWRWWCSLSPLQRNQLMKEGKTVTQGMFNKKNPFDNWFFDDQAEIYFEILTELHDLTERLGFYNTVDVIA